MRTIFSDYNEENGLVLCQKKNMTKNNSELLYVNELRKIGADAVLFRRYFRNGELKPFKSEPTVCIFQKDDTFFNTSEHVALHAKLWSASEIQIYIIKGTTRIDIINSRKPAEFNKQNEELSISNLVLASNSLPDFDEKRFSAHLFGAGTFWEQTEFRYKLDENQSPYLYLLDYLLHIRRSLLDTASNIGITVETLDKILITSILMKFLEARIDDNGKSTLQDIYEKYQIKDFSDAIENKIAINIFDELSSQFNGKIFDKFTDEERQLISEKDLNQIALFLRGTINPNTGQYFIWKQYDFKYIPAEIISAIYENFIQAESLRLSGSKEKGVVYTPIHLVNFLIDEAMPLDKPELFINGQFRVLDPTCGSGVFLVAGYKRLLQWWTINNSKDGIVRYPNSQTAVKILEENIFGVDIKKTAILVSIFGLTTALLDKLTPLEIWNDLKFSDLTQKNIEEASFFEWVYDKKDTHTFDLVIGNPPFNVEAGKKKEDVLTSKVLENLNLRHKNIPNNNFALHFFEASMLVAKKLCMIIPSNVLLYSKSSQEYRKLLFTDYTVERIYDFTHLRRDLFHKTADTPVVAVLIENKVSKRQPIFHTVVKRMLASEKKIGFEIDYYDTHLVKWNWAIDEDKFFIWKTNLLGGGRLFQLVYRLSLLPTLKKLVGDQTKYIFSTGYKIGGNTKKEPANYITGQNKITEITTDGCILAHGTEDVLQFEAPRPSLLYQPPFIIIHPKAGQINFPIAYVEHYKNKYLVFDRKFVAIKLLSDNLEELKSIYVRLNVKHPRLYHFWTIVNSSSALVKQETTINKVDIESLPFPDNEEYLNLSKEEKVLVDDVLEYSIHLGKSISKNGEGYIFEKKVNNDQLDKFGQTFCNALNEVYANNNNLWHNGSYQQKDSYIIYPFGFGDSNHFDPNSFADFISKLDFSKIIEEGSYSGNVTFRRIIRLYQHMNGFDCIFLIKPNTNRYWLQSIAIRDADETFLELQQGGF